MMRVHRSAFTAIAIVFTIIVSGILASQHRPSLIKFQTKTPPEMQVEVTPSVLEFKVTAREQEKNLRIAHDIGTQFGFAETLQAIMLQESTATGGVVGSAV